jgi:glucose-6-phosphate 1-dehydrogenase
MIASPIRYWQLLEMSLADTERLCRVTERLCRVIDERQGETGMITSKPDIDISTELCIEERPGPCGMVIFGASGDLTHRKLIPSLYKLYKTNLLPKDFFILGVARTAMNDDQFRNKIKQSIGDRSDSSSGFLSRCFYISGDYSSAETYHTIEGRLKDLDGEFGAMGNHIFYLATPPSLIRTIASNISKAGLANIEKGSGWKRVVIEKPFGKDLESAMALNNELRSFLNEDQIYRMDHYLGKETVQNILMFRFANTIFEPIWNHKYIDHVQITVAEDIGIEGRSGYYEQAGLLRDAFQNHILQMLALVTMEEPRSFGANSIRNEKIRIFKSIRPFPKKELNEFVVRGQYRSGRINGGEVVAYRNEVGVAPDSRIETYVAAKLAIKESRWKGVPFYVRSGKRLPEKLSQINIAFKPKTCCMFKEMAPVNFSPNILTLNIQPNEGIAITIQAKHPGPKLCMNSLLMDFNYGEIFGDTPPDAYERLLLDSMLGDQTLFVREEGMKLAWELLEPILENWQVRDDSPLPYPAGSWGPKQAEELITKDGRKWL